MRFCSSWCISFVRRLVCKNYDQFYDLTLPDDTVYQIVWLLFGFQCSLIIAYKTYVRTMQKCIHHDHHLHIIHIWIHTKLTTSIEKPPINRKISLARRWPMHLPLPFPSRQYKYAMKRIRSGQLGKKLALANKMLIRGHFRGLSATIKGLLASLADASWSHESRSGGSHNIRKVV